MLLSIGLATDAFAVAIADGFSEPNMPQKKCFNICFWFALFQGLMPLLGWLLIHTILEQFKIFKQFVPWIALFLLLFIGIKMIVEHFKKQELTVLKNISFKLILTQAFATSIDALSAGFAIVKNNLFSVLVCVLIVAIITFVLCFIGIVLGKIFGETFSNFAKLLGGIILIFIGFEIFISNMF